MTLKEWKSLPKDDWKTAPNWRKLTKDCLPEASTAHKIVPFWAGKSNEVLLYRYGATKEYINTNLLHTFSSWLPCEAPYAIPPLPVEEKDDGFEKYCEVMDWGFDASKQTHSHKTWLAALKAAKEHPEILEAI